MIIRILIYAAISALILLLLPNIVAQVIAKAKLTTIDSAPSKDVAIVFGAGLLRDGTPTPVLKDRVATAAALYHAGIVKKLLLSGDNRFVTYNEPAAMRTYALELGVPDQDIVLDYAGRRTYDTCYRAIHIFKVSDVILVTQAFHQPRALLTCTGLGLDVIGVTANLRQYSRREQTFWFIREVPATFRAALDIIFRPKPVMGEPEPITFD
jgi:SanA protein